MRYYRHNEESYSYVNGFPVGLKEEGKYYMYNHVRIELQYHEDRDEFEGFRVVGFEVYPASIKQKLQETPEGTVSTCEEDSRGAPLLEIDDLTTSLIYTYDVTWTASDVRWASRWDTHLKMGEGQIHWFSIVNSLLIVFFLSGMVAMILLRTLHRDIAKYNDLATDDAEESGWKLVHGDVFRKPPHSKFLAVCVGTGIQLLACSCITLSFSAIGFLSPVHRGSILQGMLLLFTFAGILAGYFSARFYKTWKGEDWRR